MKHFLTLACAASLMAPSAGAQSFKPSAALFSALDARHLGPGVTSGRITAIDGAPDSRTLYIGTAGGGVWKTTNAGVSFKPVFDKHCQSIGAVAIHPTKPETIFVGTGESNMRNSVSIGDGFYRSTDAGGTWTKMGGLDSTEHIARIAIHPKNPDIIYVAAPGPLWSDGTHRGLYRSEDGGKTFTKALYVDTKTGCAEVVIDPQNPDIVYASMWQFRRQPFSFNSGGPGSGMYKSTDGGKTWKELKNGLPAKPFGRIAFTLAPSDPKNLVAIVEAKETALFISGDGGETWKQQSATMNVVSRPFYFSTIVIDPKDPKRVYRPGYQFSYSSDGGYSFADASYDGGWVHSDHHALWIDPNNTNRLYLGTDGGVYISADRGATWNFCENLPVAQFYHVAVDNRTPYRVYGGLQDNGSWMAPSAAPGGIPNAAWTSLYFGDGFWTVPDGVDSNFAYAEYQGGNMGRIDLRTLKSINIQPQKGPGEEKLRWNWNTPLLTGIADPRNLYTGSQYLYKSTNGGRAWTRISPDLTTNDKKKQKQEESGGLSADNTSAENHCTIFTITEAPGDANTIWVGTDDGNLQVTQDGGKTWKNTVAGAWTAGIPRGAWVSSIEPSRHDKNTVYATFENHMYGDHQTYLARSTDGGQTWTQLKSDEFTGFAHKIREDLVNKDLLFLGTEMGLFATLDGGLNWFRMKSESIPYYSLVRDIQIHPKTHDVVLGTHGRGILIIDAITPMRALTQDIAAKPVHLFEMKSVPATQSRFGSGGYPSTGGWMAWNPVTIPPIQYYLKERLSTGEATVEILDKDGKLVQEFPAGKRRGINKVYWNLAMKPPKVAEGGTKPDYSAFTAPMVMPGTYTVRLKLGDQTYTTPLTVEHDASNPEFTLEDRRLQYNTAMDLYRLHERLAKVVAGINEEQKGIKTLQSTAKMDAKAAKALDARYKALEDLRTTLLASKQKSVFADERKLREEISEVYGAVIGQEAAPSNLHVQRVTELEKKVAEAEKAYEKLQKDRKIAKGGQRIS